MPALRNEKERVLISSVMTANVHNEWPITTADSAMTSLDDVMNDVSHAGVQTGARCTHTHTHTNVLARCRVTD